MPQTHKSDNTCQKLDTSDTLGTLDIIPIGVNLRKYRNYYDHFSIHMVIGVIRSLVP